jgi:hypothetical protein
MIPPNAITISNINNNNYDYDYDGATEQQQQYHYPIVWTWANSLLFAISQIGEILMKLPLDERIHTFPTSPHFQAMAICFHRHLWGKILLVPFAIVGIPIFLVAITDLGRFIAELLNATYRRVWKFYRKCRYAMQEKRRRNRKPQPSAATAGTNTSFKLCF